MTNSIGTGKRMKYLTSKKDENFNRIDWGIENLTYNEIKKEFNLLNAHIFDLGRKIILQDMYENNPELKFFKILLKERIEKIYLLGFQRGFEEGGLAMEIELSLNEDDNK